jgi:lysophospholipase L1-like esterase
MLSFLMSTPRIRSSAICLTTLWSAMLCTSSSAFAAKADRGQEALERVVVIGDSLSAGFQNFSLFTSTTGGQTFGFAAVIAQQAGVSLSLPTISYPGIPPALALSAGQIVREAGLGSRINPAQATNLSVPGFTVGNVLAYPFPGNPTVNTIDALSDTILGTPPGPLPCGPIPTSLISWLPLPPSISSLIPAGSPYIVSETACALVLAPSTVIVSIGSNDVLQALTLGTPPTSPAVFQTNYHLLIEALALTRANLVVANVPDITKLPFVVNSSAFMNLCGVPLPAGISYVVPNLAAATFDICTNNIPVTPSEITSIQALVSQYNSIITSEIAAQNKRGVTAAVVDINTVLNTLSANGYNLPGIHLTTAFLGGLFSLDGIHPTNTGYAILANTFINTINGALGTKIPLANIQTVASHDPLVFP